MNPQSIANGAANGGTAAPRVLRTKISFRLRVPEFVKLEFDPPREARPGNWGDQYMYFCAQNRIAFVEPVVHEKLVSLGARAGETFAITKEPNGAWEVQRQPTNPETERWIEQESRPRDFARADPPRQTAPEPALRNEGPNIMAHALTQAMEACKLAGFAEASREDIRALAITIYINTMGGRK